MHITWLRIKEIPVKVCTKQFSFFRTKISSGCWWKGNGGGAVFRGCVYHGCQQPGCIYFVRQCAVLFVDSSIRLYLQCNGACTLEATSKCFDWTRIEGKILLFRRRWHRWLPLSREKRLPCSKINFTSPFYATHQSVFFVCQFQNFHCSQYPVCPFTLDQAPINTKGSAPQFAICLWRRMFAICRGFLCFHAPAVFVFN